jgi:hypothetical protein
VPGAGLSIRTLATQVEDDRTEERGIVRAVWNPYKRFLGWFLSFALLVPPVFYIGLARGIPAEAQIATKPLIVVYDFDNLTKMGGGLLGRSATDAVVVEMQKTGRYEVVRRDQVIQEMEIQELSLPLDSVAMAKIAEALGATQYALGSVTKAKINTQASAKQAEVEIAVRIVDRFSGELANGAVVSALSARRLGYTGTDQALLNEALSKAAYLAVQEIVAEVVPEGQVQFTFGKDEISINRGSADGVKTGMRFVILRPRGNEMDVIGRATVTDVETADCSARIDENLRGIRSEDIARAVFEMPEVGPKPIGEVLKNKGPHLAKMLLGLAVLVALISLTKKGSKGGDIVRGVVAQATNENDALGINGPGVVVTFKSAEFENAYENIFEYRIYRDDVGLVGTVEPRTGTMTWVNDTVGGEPYSYYTPAEPPVWVDDDPTAGLTRNTDGVTPAVTTGQHYRYSVTVIHRQSREIQGSTGDTSGGEAVTQYRAVESPRSLAMSGQVTVLNPTGILTHPVNNSTSVDLKDVSFRWELVGGGNRYAIQASTDVSFQTGTVTLGPVQKVGTEGTEVEYRAKNDERLIAFGRLPGPPVVFWRVGARNSADSPGPYTGYVWSDPYAFEPQEEPPVHP